MNIIRMKPKGPVTLHCSLSILLFIVLLSSCLILMPDYFHSLAASSSSDEEDENNGDSGEEGPATTTPPPTWKTFNDPKGLFTIQYPSNWIPSRVPNSPNPIDMDLEYYGEGDDYARFKIQKFATSPFFNPRDSLEDESRFNQGNYTDYTVERPIECTNYKLSGSISTCSMIDSWQEEDGRFQSLTISAIDGDEEYYLYLTTPSNLFNHFQPVADYMIKSFKLA